MSDAVNNPTTVESTPGTNPVSTDVKPDVTADKGEQQQQPKKLHQKKEGEETAENEIKVAAKGQIKNYLGYAFRVLNKTDHRSLKIRATGNAIVKALILIELVKRRVGDLHQINQIYSMEIVTYEETKIEGQEMVPSKRRVTAMDTVLSKDPLDTQDPGYQQPEPKDDTPMVSNQPKKEKSGNKKNQNKQKKTYNDIPVAGKNQGEEETKGQRQDRDNKKEGKHEQDKDKKQRGPREFREKNDNNEIRGERQERGRGGRGQRGMDPKSRKDNLRNIINDDEFEPRNKDNYRGDRDGRGQQRGRGGNRGRGDGRRDRGGPPLEGGPGNRGNKRGGHFNDRRGDGGYNGPMDNNYGPPYRMRQQYQDDDDHHYRNVRAYDDFNMHKPSRGAGPRRRGAPEGYYMQRDPNDRYYNNGPPQHYGMRQGGPRERFNDNYDGYYGAPPSEMRQYGPPGMYQGGPPQMRGGRDGQFQPRPNRGGQGPPPIDGEQRRERGPPGDMETIRGHGPPPMRARGSGGRGRGDYRGGRGGGEDRGPPEGMRGMGRGEFRGRGDRGDYRGGGPPRERGGYEGHNPMRGGDMGRPQRARGSRGGPDRGGRGNFQGRPQEDDEGGYQRDAGPKIHTRSRGGAQQQI